MPDINGTYTETGLGPLKNWRVELLYPDVYYGGWVRITHAMTDPGGGFAMSLSTEEAGKRKLLSTVDVVEVRLVNSVRRVIDRKQFVLPLFGTYVLGTISVHPNNLRGWLATNLDPGGGAMRLSTNNTVTPTIDNAAAWSALRTALTGATNEILMQIFYFDVNYVFATFAPEPPSIGTTTTGTRLEEDLLVANRTRAVTVRLLVRDHTPLPYPIHTAERIEAYFATAPPNTVEVRRYITDPRLPMHAKFVVVDGVEAHLTSSPFLQEYFDGPSHRIDEPRRGPLSRSSEPAVDFVSWLAGIAWSPPNLAVFLAARNFAQVNKNSIRVPVHDVGACIRGGAVDALKETFYEHWNVAGAPTTSTLTSASPAGPTSSVQIVRSLPRATFPLWPEGEASILESYLRCFSEATDFLYLENQYLTEFRILNAIRLCLMDGARPNLQLVLLINHKVDIPPYQRWQTARLNQLKRNLTDDGTIGRFGVFTLWSHDNTVTPQRIISNYVHTKVGIADDSWATIGSANLDGVSLMTGEHLAPVAFLPGMENRRSTEVNATIFNAVDGQGASSVPGDLRRALWAEHLGLNGPTDPLLAVKPAGGWLSLWTSRAAGKLASLKGSPPTSHPCRVLEWRPEAEPKNYLKALGVDVRQFEVLDEFKGFDFTTGNWQE